ncbi:tyrosine-type recombinase/integrase [Streptomyces shenzhenensis]|uniref:tyrosine-type recombinase/integrase n=1 Tax=Streptomyces shenzhenensis TaxID=943815 RepID=UPI003556021A
MSPNWQPSGHVFTRPGGHPIDPATLTRHFHALLREARLQPVRFHDLRHSTATLLLAQGVELVVIKELAADVASRSGLVPDGSA